MVELLRARSTVPAQGHQPPDPVTPSPGAAHETSHFQKQSFPTSTCLRSPAPGQDVTLHRQRGTSIAVPGTAGWTDTTLRVGQVGGFGAQTPLGTSWGPFTLHEPHRCLRGVKLVTSAHCSSSCGTDPQSGPSPLGCPWRRQRQDVTFPPFCLHTWPVLNKRFALTAAKAKLFHHLARKPGWGKARLRAHVSHWQPGKGTPGPLHPAQAH